MKTYLFLAEGFEEIEAITVIDVLRRGDVDVEIVSISDSREVKGAHGVSLVADLLLKQVVENEAACLIFPGGMPGAKYLSECKQLIDLLQRHFDKKGRVAAICAAPALVLGKLHTDRRLRMTCYPGFEGYLPQVDVVSDGVVCDGQILTAKGPAFSMVFALTLLEQLTSKQTAEQVAGGMLVS